MTIQLATARLREGRPAEALELLDGLPVEHASAAPALFLSALALEDLARPLEALEQYERALERDPDMVDAWHNRGLLLARLGRLAEAERSHRDYLARHSHSPRARSDLADVLLALDRHEEASALFLDLLKQDPSNVTAGVGHAIALSAQGRFEDARRAIAHLDAGQVAQYVTRLAPGADAATVLSPENIFLWRGFVAQRACSWGRWKEYIATFRSVAREDRACIEPALAFAAFHTPLDGRERHLLARRVAQAVEARVSALPPRPVPVQNRIRVGILSPDLREHLNAYLLLPLFELLDRRRFELHAYSLSVADDSAIGLRIRQSTDNFVELHGMSDAEAAACIRAHDVDILVDAGGHSTGGRFGITAARPASIQVIYLGFPGSIGSERADYAIVDRVVAPVSAPEEWTEARAYLPDTYYLYDFREDRSPASVRRAEYGLPEQAFVFCAFHKAEKITPDAFALWMNVMKRVPGSLLWFASLSAVAQTELRAAARIQGVDPTRLAFATFEPRPRYLARQALGDLMLDAVDHGAMTTACDALGAGLPVLTLKGTSMATRATESLLMAAGLPELVAPSAQAFLERAIDLAQDTARLARVRKKLAANRRSAALFDTAARVRQLENAFAEMYLRATRGQPPESFTVPVTAT